MELIKSRLARKLVLFIFSVSFILITGSFIYFYYSAKSFLLHSAENEINLFHKYFEQSASAQIQEFNNEINGAVVDIIYNTNKSTQDLAYKQFVKSIINIGVEYYFYNKMNFNAHLITSIKVFGGEEVINQNKIGNIQYNNLYNSIKVIKQIDKSSSYCYSSGKGENEFYIKKELKDLVIIVKLNGVYLFNQLIQKIYYPEKINFSIVNKENIFEYSTNKFWVNQKIEKFFQYSLSLQNSYADEDNNMLFSNWQNQLFVNTLVITNDLSKEYNDFYQIIYRVLFYSIIICLFINIIAFIYINKLSKSLNEISNVTRKIGEGEFNTKINIKRKDEVGDLIISFNKMVDNLKDSYSKINLANTELELKIKELYETKNELTKKQKLALIGETISKISHEIQNKISGVSVWVQNLEMQSSLDKNTEIYVKEIKKSLTSFVEMLLNFKKFYRKPYLEKSSFDLTDLIGRIVLRYSSDTEAKKIKIEMTDTENSEILGDKNLIDEAITNLFVNALYFSPKEGKIKIETAQINDTILFAIQNQGPQIKEENIENIFNPFFTTKSSGSGLGLAICKNIIEAHNGEISVTNLMPIGTKFEFYLPLNIKNKQ